MTDNNRSEQRRYLRFTPEDVGVAMIHFTDRAPDDIQFDPDTAGLVMEEAYAGCGLVVPGEAGQGNLREGTPCLIRINKIGPIQAEVRWVKTLDEGVAKIGIEYRTTS